MFHEEIGKRKKTSLHIATQGLSREQWVMRLEQFFPTQLTIDRWLLTLKPLNKKALSFEQWALSFEQLFPTKLTVDYWLLNSLNFKPLNKKAVSFEQWVLSNYSQPNWLLTIDRWLLNFKPLNPSSSLLSTNSPFFSRSWLRPLPCLLRSSLTTLARPPPQPSLFFLFLA